MFHKAITAVMALALLSGCASQASLNNLAEYQAGCAAGRQGACDLVPMAQQQVDQEKHENTKLVAGAVLLPLLAVALVAGAAAAAPPPPVFVVCRWHCY